MRQTLNLDGDDCLDIVCDMERAFEIELGDEAEQWYTIADAHAGLCKKLKDAPSGTKCATAMAFYRVRRALCNLGVDIDIRPDTPLRLLSNGSPRSLFAKLRSRLKHAMPLPALTWGSYCIGPAFVGFGTSGLILLFDQTSHGLIVWTVWIASLIIGIATLTFDPGQFPRDCQTVGGLAQRVAGLNSGGLVNAGARRANDDVWDALVEVVSNFAGVSKSEIGPETTFVRNPRSKTA